MDYESFCATLPPIHPDDLGPPPGSILLDVWGYISFRTNATNAEGFSTTNKRVKVTFWAAHPPRPSCFTVYSPDVELSTALRYAPKIINTEDDLVLLRVPIRRSGGILDMYDNNYFVYQAGTDNKGPSLELVPEPRPRPDTLSDNSDYQLGLLRCRDRDMYFVARLAMAALPDEEDKYYLELYRSDSETKTWSTKLMTSGQKQHIGCAGKVIAIGGELGSVGWVNLRRGILICDVLLDNRELRYIPLPSPAVPRPYWLSSGLSFRDVIVAEGLIKYFEMCVTREGGGGWEAVEWGRKHSWIEWTKHRVIKVSVDPEAEIKEQPTLKAYSGFPALSLHDAGVVYIMDRHCSMDKEVLVVAFDMRKQTLKGEADYVRRLPLACNVYCASGISKHLRWTSSPRGQEEKEEHEQKSTTLNFAGPLDKDILPRLLDTILQPPQGTSTSVCKEGKTSDDEVLTLVAPLVDHSVGDDMGKLAEDNKPINIKLGYPPLPEEPCEGPHICKVKIRLPNGRKIRRNFWHTDHIKLLWSLAYPEVKDGDKRVFHFVQIFHGKCKYLDFESDLTFKDAQITNSTLNFLWG